jgi:hypothetical protein
MNKFYTKLNYKISNYNWESVKTSVELEYTNHPKLTYFNVTKKSSKLFCSCFPSEIFNHGNYGVNLLDINGKGTVYPHVDYGIKCALNFYFCPNESITYWYNVKPNAVMNVDDKTNSKWYNFEDLDLADTFKADKNDVYLLNTSSVHSVVHAMDDSRKIIQIQWYDTTYSIIQEILLNDLGTK